MGWVLFVLNIIGSGANLLDFLIGKDGDKSIKDKLLKFYISVEIGDWTKLYKSPAILIEKFIYGVGKDKILSRKYIFNIAILSILVNFTIISMVLISNALSIFSEMYFSKSDCFSSFPDMIHEMLSYTYLIPVVLLQNIFIDIFSWTILIYLIKRVCSDNRYISFSYISVMPVMVFLLYNLAMAPYIIYYVLHNGYDNYILREAFLTPINNLKILYVYCSEPRTIDLSARTMTFFNISALTAIMPITLLAVISTLGIFLYITRPITQKPVSVLIEKIESYPKGVLTLFAIFVGAIASGLSAFAKI